MDSEKVIQDLNQRFAQPLPEFYKRRIIFWCDEEREFEDKLDEIVLRDAKLIALTGTNYFAAKKLLGVEDPTGNYVVYCSLSYEKPEDDWLLDIRLYSEEYRADLISNWMDEMGLPQTAALRKQVKEYRKFFKAAVRREKIAKQKNIPSVPRQLDMAVMGALAGIVDVTPYAIIKKVLCAGLDTRTNSMYCGFADYGIDKAFWNMVQKGTGYVADIPNLGHLAAHILLTSATRTMQPEYLSKWKDFVSEAHQAYCYDFVSEWLHSTDADQLREIVIRIEEELKLSEQFMKLDVADLVNTETFPCIHELILIKLMTEIADSIIDVNIIRETVEKRRTCVWYEEVKDFYEGILQVANMQDFFKEHTTGFHSAQAVKVWKEYTTEYYKMDTYYRLFHRSYGRSLKTYHAKLHDLFSHMMEKAEGLYKNWFLGQLGENWSKVCAEEMERYGKILEVPQQTDFYKSKVKNADNRVFVIISDALRYEVAADLAEQLRRETKSQVDLSSMQSIFPTITKFGMAALLPHEKLSVKFQGNIVDVFADGKSTESHDRDRILKSDREDSVALKYTDLVTAKRQERSTWVKSKNVVYIYHDTIDEASHTSDTLVFPACDDAMEELKNIVRIITSDFGGTNIMITADHGFLYTYSPLTEDDKADNAGFKNRIIEYGRRYAIMMKDSKPEYLQYVKFLDGNTDYEAYAPKENVRIKMNGGGLNYVHGGISLQELCVPLIEYHFLRKQSKEYQRNKEAYDTKPVEISLLSATHKISNMIFSLNFYQKEAVGDNRAGAVYQVYFTDGKGKQISDVQKIIADKTSENGQERTFRCSFNLKSLKYDNKEIYYLVIAEEGGEIKAQEEFQIDIALAVDDFDFFG
mgnify:FL=1